MQINIDTISSISTLNIASCSCVHMQINIVSTRYRHEYGQIHLKTKKIDIDTISTISTLNMNVKFGQL